MKELKRRIVRPLVGIGAVAVLSALAACAQQTEFEVTRSTEVTINAEDVEQIPIQEVRARERAGLEASRCGGSGSSRVGCDQDAGVDVDVIFGPEEF